MSAYSARAPKGCGCWCTVPPPSCGGPAKQAPSFIRQWQTGRVDGAHRDLYCLGGDAEAEVAVLHAISPPTLRCLQVHQTTLNRVGRGGLGEAAGPSLPGGHQTDSVLSPQEEAALLLGPTSQQGSRRDGAVALTEIVRKPSEAENALRLLLHQLRLLRPQDPQTAGGLLDL